MLLKPVAVITGANRGIGRAIALEFARIGYDILVHYNKNHDQALQLKIDIEALGQKAVIIQADISNKEEAQQVIKCAYDTWGKIDVLVNNAGITKDARFVFMRDDEWHDVINVNLNGVFNVTRAAIYRMIIAKSGCIVNLSSVAGIKGIIGQVNYCAAKSGLIGFTKALAREVAEYNISINCIAPGYIITDMTSSMPEIKRKVALSEIPMKKFGCVDQISSLVAYLASENAKYITGQVFCVDGGLSA